MVGFGLQCTSSELEQRTNTAIVIGPPMRGSCSLSCPGCCRAAPQNLFFLPPMLAFGGRLYSSFTSFGTPAGDCPIMNRIRRAIEFSQIVLGRNTYMYSSVPHPLVAGLKAEKLPPFCTALCKLSWSCIGATAVNSNRQPRTVAYYPWLRTPLPVSGGPLSFRRLCLCTIQRKTAPSDAVHPLTRSTLRRLNQNGHLRRLLWTSSLPSKELRSAE